MVALSSHIYSLIYGECGRLAKAEYGWTKDDVHLQTVGFIYLVLVNHYGKRWLEAKYLFGTLSHFVLWVFFFFLRPKWIQSWNIHVCCFIFRTQVRRGSPEVTPQQTGAGHSHVSRTVKRYPSSTAPITSNALPSANGHNHRHAHTQQVAYSNGQPHASRNAVTPKG